MDAKLFTKMLSDRNIIDLKKMQYKYSPENVDELIHIFKDTMYKTLPIRDFKGNNLVYLESMIQVKSNTVKHLLLPQNDGRNYGLKAMEDEIFSTLNIENINTSRDSIRSILNGYVPTNDDENRIYGMKKGLDFVSNMENKITEDNIHQLYKLTVGDFLSEDEKLLPENLYRHDNVYIVGNKIEHEGLPYSKLSKYMREFMSFINEKSTIDNLSKAVIIHFYLAYLHPYFDGNGRMARLMHLWYLVQQGYSSALYVPLSRYIIMLIQLQSIMLESVGS